MPIVSVQTYLQGILNGLPMPGSAGYNLAAYITAPDPNVEAQFPTAYIWPTDGDESRNPRLGGTVPRAAEFGAPSGMKSIEHRMDIFLIYFMASDDPDADNSFPGMVDAVMAALRYITMPQPITDPYTGQQTTLMDVGEFTNYEIVVSAIADQSFNRYDSRIRLKLNELIFA